MMDGGQRRSWSVVAAYTVALSHPGLIDLTEAPSSDPALRLPQEHPTISSAASHHCTTEQAKLSCGGGVCLENCCSYKKTKIIETNDKTLPLQNGPSIKG